METATGGILLFQLLFFGVFGLFGLAAMVLWVWMLIDCLQNESSEGNDKLTWVLVIVLTHWIGALIYLFVRRPQRIRDQHAASTPPVLKV
ncbi:MAG: PLD nuclease N-terminal domain-containing protein [Opitutaceae bacterium]